MRLVAISDLHGNLPGRLPAGDLLVIAGDICPDLGVAGQARWLDIAFRDWLGRMRAAGFQEIVGCAGNHDFVFQKGEHPVDLPWRYLCDDGVQIGAINIWGTPWQPPFCDWAFNAPESDLDRLFSQIPDDTDVLISHSPAHGVLDRTRSGLNVGSTSLLTHVRRVRPALHVFGHIHEACGRRVRRHVDDSGQLTGRSAIAANVSICDLDYLPINAPQVFTLDGVPAAAEPLAA